MRFRDNHFFLLLTANSWTWYIFKCFACFSLVYTVFPKRHSSCKPLYKVWWWSVRLTYNSRFVLLYVEAAHVDLHSLFSVADLLCWLASISFLRCSFSSFFISIRIFFCHVQACLDYGNPTCSEIGGFGTYFGSVFLYLLPWSSLAWLGRPEPSGVVLNTKRGKWKS